MAWPGLPVCVCVCVFPQPLCVSSVHTRVFLAWISLQVVGSKLWLFLPPASAAFAVNVTALEWFTKHVFSGEGGLPGAMVAVQHPGDWVFVPEFWGHAVLNLGDTVSVALESFQ